MTGVDFNKMQAENTEIQNFVTDFKEGEANSFWDSVYAPCMMLLCANGKGFRYCHFDEYNLDELRTFVDLASKNGNKNIAFFGGYGSENVSKLFRHITKKGLGRITQRDFVDFVPIKEIKVAGNDFYFLGDSEKKQYSFDDLHKILG